MRGAVAKRWRGGRAGGSRGEKARGASRWRGSAGHGVARQAACRGDDGHAPFASRMTGGQGAQCQGGRWCGSARRRRAASICQAHGGRRSCRRQSAHGAFLVQFGRGGEGGRRQVGRARALPGADRPQWAANTGAARGASSGAYVCIVAAQCTTTAPNEKGLAFLVR